MMLVKQKETFQCDQCFDTVYKVDLTVNGYITVSMCQDCIQNKEIKETDIEAANVRCRIIKEKNIDPENTKAFQIEIKNLRAMAFPERILKSLTTFLERYPDIKRKNKHIEILKNPHNFRIVRPVEPHQFTALHLFTRNQVFQIIGDQKRKAYLKKSEITDDVIDITIDREFIGWGGNLHFTISGPVLRDYDQSVFDALVKLWHEKTISGITISTNLSEIWKSIGNKSNLSIYNKESLKRSLSRLHKVSIEAKSIDKKNKNFWGGGIIDNVVYIEGSNSKNNQVLVTFNIYMASSYLQGSYATLNHPVYQKLSSYSKKIYIFLMSHDNRERKIEIHKLKNLIGVDNDLSDKYLKAQINKSVKELKKYKILEDISKIERDILCTTITQEAWDAKPSSFDNDFL